MFKGPPNARAWGPQRVLIRHWEQMITLLKSGTDVHGTQGNNSVTRALPACRSNSTLMASLVLSQQMGASGKTAVCGMGP